MEPLDLEGLDRARADHDRLVLASQDVDWFCSSTDWMLPAAEALMPPRAPFLRRGSAGYVSLMRAEYPDGAVLQPLEVLWGLGCPLVGSDPRALAADLLEECSGKREILMLTGLAPGSPRMRAVVGALARRYEINPGRVTRRTCASLAGGLDGFLARRSAKLRKTLRQAERRATKRGIAFEAAEVAERDVDRAFARILSVEARSWKGRRGVGIEGSELAAFYRSMVGRLARRGGLRLMFALRDGEDLAYILGGVIGNTYRGLQFSFAAGYEDCALGNLAQYHQIRALCAEGIALYDLGVAMPYKRRWGEITRDTVTVFALPR